MAGDGGMSILDSSFRTSRYRGDQLAQTETLESPSQKGRASINGAHASQAEDPANGHSINFGRCIHYAFDLTSLPNLDDISHAWLSSSKVEGT